MKGSNLVLYKSCSFFTESPTVQSIRTEMHRYQCRSCGRVFTEDSGLLRHPGTRITERAAAWLRGLVRFHIQVSVISSFTSIRWNTICGIHREYMNGNRLSMCEETGAQQRQRLKRRGFF